METNTKILLAILALLILVTLPITIPLACIIILIVLGIILGVICWATGVIDYILITLICTIVIMCVGYKAYWFLGRNG